jgi:hypothetical protein
MDGKLDGNAAGGILREIFPFEMTVAQTTCVTCGATNAIGALAAYVHGMGTVLRCPSCDHALMRIAHANGRYLLDMQGVRVLEISDESAQAQ